MWEGTDAPVPAGPWGVVELPAMSAVEQLNDAVEMLELLHGLQNWAEAQKARLVDRIRELYELEKRHELDDVAVADEQAVSLAAEEIGALLRMPARSAKTLVEHSRLLLHRNKQTFSALETGKLSWRHATVVVDECLGVPLGSAGRFERKLVESAKQSTVTKLTRTARGLRELLHPEAAPVRKAHAVADRRVVLEPAPDGMAWLSAYLPAEQACGIYQRLDAGARQLQSPTEPRTLTQLRADVFADVLTHTCQGDLQAGTGFRGISAAVHVTVPALTLLNVVNDGGSSSENSSDGAACRPSAAHTSAVLGDEGDEVGSSVGGSSQSGVPVLEGYGPIDADTAARMAAHARSFSRILTHPETGADLSIGRESYRPPRHLQDWVRIRDKTCRHPGCNRVASACEIDHTVPWHRGGATSHSNLECLCKKHHMFKTNGDWKYGQPEPGTITAASPAGKTYTTQPPPF